MIEISPDGMKKAKFLGRGIVDGEHVVDLWELDMGTHKLPAALDAGTRTITRKYAGYNWELRQDECDPNAHETK